MRQEKYDWHDLLNIDDYKCFNDKIYQISNNLSLLF